MKMLILLFSFSAFAANFKGTFKAQEVEGSKTLYDLSVDYDISLNNSSVSFKPFLSGVRDIERGYSAESLMSAFFTATDPQMLVYAQTTTLKTIAIAESSVGIGKKRLKLTSEWSVIDTEKVNETLKQTIIVDERELHFDEHLIKLPLVLTICVGQDRRLSRSVKHLGCQEIQDHEFKAGTVMLNEIDFHLAHSNRNLVFFYDWRVKGTWLSGVRGPGPFVVVER